MARELHGVLSTLDAPQRLEFYRFLANNFAPAPARLTAAAQAYLAAATAQTAADLAVAAEPVRQELLRRMNMSPGGTAMLVAMRKELLQLLKAHPELQPLDADLLHLLASWFNRGFLELRRIDWNTPAAVLDKLITYEAVHEIQGWDDLRRRLAPDRRCFGFFHPALPGEPLIFVEVALVTGLAGAVQGLLARDTDEDEQRLSRRPSRHGDFLLHLQLPGRAARHLLRQFPDQAGGGGAAHRAAATCAFFDALPGARLCRLAGQAWSPTRPFSRRPCGRRIARRWRPSPGPRTEDDAKLLRAALALPEWWDGPAAAALQPPLLRLCATYLTTVRPGKGAQDPVARFHLGNGARLERINWLGNSESARPAGIARHHGQLSV